MNKHDASDLIAEIESSLAGEGVSEPVSMTDAEYHFIQAGIAVDHISELLLEVLNYDPAALQPTEQYAALCRAEKLSTEVEHMADRLFHILGNLREHHENVTRKIWNFSEVFCFDTPEHWRRDDGIENIPF